MKIDKNICCVKPIQNFIIDESKIVCVFLMHICQDIWVPMHKGLREVVVRTHYGTIIKVKIKALKSEKLLTIINKLIE